ncbi:SDR family oxidoreductase [Phytomonospora endophytica]|uniref:NAD(P)-dependent dehydrogenase (Short-subunit alcohol dehydrogenase family) n=1 Tax=Phytomonospora endophytica TaxID=714109 RepID=A0A841FYQ5_9ACTN|nr:SDR family oxidoreductase [Phytomonospora endophytica]MBB6039873.1 NAD(P)-dependent dehydrogenase (short-subunit alcohol dehydrogenase family) [Phytomonospora endophytica]GIG71057.1 short-chain dehydrogenase [Phytomonospora endophytica]
MAETIALVTGANKGLGRETVRRLAAEGWTVLLGARDRARGEQAAAELGRGVVFVELDVTSEDSVAAAARTVADRFGRLDVLVNNAGVGAPPTIPEDTTADELRAVFDVNVLGPVRVTRAFLPLLRKGTDPRVVMVSSGMGSIAVYADPRLAALAPPMLAYPASKAALNMLTAQYARGLDGIRVNAVDPGYTATDLTGGAGFQTLEEGTDAIIRLASIGADGPTGGFFDRNGDVAW